ncbi:hypothetical protein FGO68_gene9986 [Halteria grandinella]|uniref:Uncharacterized protein n=1 Tax=Halteria grandinella TaxID=5974 RepID=A0A8J8STY6_HALGN|nr:hypothetical protein FGO68_gene9986 [Halteria grandinella]
MKPFGDCGAGFGCTKPSRSMRSRSSRYVVGVDWSRFKPDTIDSNSERMSSSSSKPSDSFRSLPTLRQCHSRQQPLNQTRAQQPALRNLAGIFDPNFNVDLPSQGSRFATCSIQGASDHRLQSSFIQ